MTSPTPHEGHPNRQGQRLGNYQLERLLGRGGFAEVYLARHLRLQRAVALKVLHASLSSEDVNTFQREAQTIASLEHPHIVRIYDFDVQEQTAFLVMEYLPQGTLRQRYPRGQRLGLETVVSLCSQVAEALEYAHQQRIIHRDVKPENMLLGKGGQVVLSDFGIATIAHQTSSMRTQDLVGTIPYMAPEQIKGHPRAASDQYALAVIVYEWLCGERPFGGTATEIFAQHLMTPAPPLRQKIADLPEEVEQVVLTALDKEPKERFSSVVAFARALQQAGHLPPRVSLPSSSSSLPTVAKQGTPAPAVPPPAPATRAPTLAATQPAAEPVSAVASTSQSLLTPLPAPAETSKPSALGAAGGSPVGEPGQGKRLSRRGLLVGLSLTGLALVAGGGILWGISQSLPLVTYRGHTSSVHTLGWSPDGKLIASGGFDKTVQVWEVASGKKVLIYDGHTAEVVALDWSPDGKRIASGSWDNTVQVWEPTNGKEVLTYRGHTAEVMALGWSADDQRIASGSYDNTVQVWEAR
jgi:serine/threonine protein kinase